MQLSSRYRTKKTVKEEPKASSWRYQVLVGLLLTAVVGGLTAGVYYVSHIPSLQITSVVVTGGATIPGETVKALVTSQLEGSYFRLLPRTFRYTYPASAITASLLNQDRIAAVDLQLTSGHELSVHFTEYVPHALWCQPESGERCFFIDAEGYSFAVAPTLQGNAFVRYVTPGDTPRKEVYAFHSDFLREQEVFMSGLASLGYFISAVTVSGSEDYEYHIFGGGSFKVSQTLPLNRSLSNLTTVLQAPEFSHLAPGAFSYIDLRFGDKVFVREKDEELETSTATSSDAVSNEVADGVEAE